MPHFNYFRDTSSGTVITCFDRRWDEDNKPQSNIFDNVLWKLREQARRIQTPYEMANLVIDEASSYFFTYSDSLPEALRFRELFRKAIGDVVSFASSCLDKYG